MTMQLRPRSTEDARFYAPNRDIAYCFTGLAKVAMYGLEEINLEPWFKEYLKSNNITQEDLGQAALLFCEAIKLMVADETQSAQEAVEKSGFFSLPSVAQAAVCCKLGQVLLGAYFTCVRDTLPMGAGPPADVEDLCKAGKEVAHYFEEKAKESGRCSGSTDTQANFAVP